MKLKDVIIRDWMTSNVITVAPNTAISEAHKIMKSNNIRRLPVVEDDKLVGMVTIGDVREASPSGATTLSIWELNYLWSQLQIKDVMSHKVLTVNVDGPMINAAKIMLEEKVSGLPVLDESKSIVGIVTESDVFRMLVKSQADDL